MFGSIVGSFLNVCIYRFPREESIVLPGSHCPHCQKMLSWYDNIPFLSYIFLKGKCRYCHQRISFRYFLVELLTALFFLTLFLKFGLGWELIIYLFFISSLIIATFTDFDHLIIPDVVTYPTLILGLILSTVYPSMQRSIFHWSTISASSKEGFLSSLVGALLGGLFLYAIGIFGEMAINLFGKKELKKEVSNKGGVMGGGDIKLLAMIGAFLGWQLVALTIFLSALSGSIAGIILKFKKGESYIPYGPYLALGAVISLLEGEKLINWYLHRIGG
ncbi:MAG: prepilin peptidase [Nitrospirae bacterium]|nr:prepilin peptidase [Nitrospirota bacterium]